MEKALQERLRPGDDQGESRAAHAGVGVCASSCHRQPGHRSEVVVYFASRINEPFAFELPGKEKASARLALRRAWSALIATSRDWISHMVVTPDWRKERYRTAVKQFQLDALSKMRLTLMLFNVRLKLLLVISFENWFGLSVQPMDQTPLKTTKAI